MAEETGAFKKSQAVGAPFDDTSERDRFVGFAFAGADLLIEASPDGTIVFAAGACRALLNKDAEALQGRPLDTCFRKSYSKTISSMLDSSASVGRHGPIQMRAMSGVAVDVSLCRLPQTGSNVFVSVTRRIVMDAPFPRDRTDAFLETAAVLAEDPDAAITVFNVDTGGQDAVPPTMDIAKELESAIGAFLHANAASNTGAAQFGEGQFGLVHRNNQSVENLSDELEDVIREVDPSLAEVDVKMQTIQAQDLGGEQDHAKYLLKKVIDDFCGDPTSVEGGVKDKLRDEIFATRERVGWLRSRIAEDSFELYLQPIVDLQSASIDHYESLIRFEADKSPFEIVRFAEDMALVTDLDAAVLHRALAMLSDNSINQDIGLAINVSGLTIQSQPFVQHVIERYRKAEGAKDRLILEITESARIENLDQVQGAVAALRKEGITVCLDDFGAGAASFPYLHALDVDCVKIDGRYVTRMLENSRDYFMIKALSELCGNLGIVTVAEYIEETLQLEALRDLGIAQGQGYLFGKPVALDELSRNPVADTGIIGSALPNPKLRHITMNSRRHR